MWCLPRSACWTDQLLCVDCSGRRKPRDSDVDVSCSRPGTLFLVKGYKHWPRLLTSPSKQRAISTPCTSGFELALCSFLQHTSHQETSELYFLQLNQCFDSAIEEKHPPSTYQRNLINRYSHELNYITIVRRSRFKLYLILDNIASD